MKKLLTLLLTIVAFATANAGQIIFYGIVDQSPTYPVGSPFNAYFQFNGQSQVTKYHIEIGSSTVLDGRTGGGNVYFDNNFCHPSVYYQVTNSALYEIEMQVANPNCQVPPFDQWNLNDFIFQNNTFGHFTALPVVSGK